MPFSKQTLNKLNEILRGQDFSETNTVVQKTCFKKDSAELAMDVGEIGIHKIEAFEFSVETPALQVVEISAVDLHSSVTKKSLATQNDALNALQTAASTEAEEQKVAILSDINKNDSLTKTIHDKIQISAVPMLFAVFSRKNDAYGLG